MLTLLEAWLVCELHESEPLARVHVGADSALQDMASNTKPSDEFSLCDAFIQIANIYCTLPSLLQLLWAGLLEFALSCCSSTSLIWASKREVL